MTAVGITALHEAHPDCEAALGAIRWMSEPSSPWPSARPLLDVAIEALPYIESDFDADLIEQLALALEDTRDEARALRATLSEALRLAHTQHREIERLCRVYHGAIDELRQQQRADL